MKHRLTVNVLATFIACTYVCRAAPGLVSHPAVELPECGLRCALANIPLYCNSAYDLACICNDENMRIATQTCLRNECTPLDQMKTARAEAELCNRHARSRKRDNIAALAIEIPAWFAVWARMYSRWVTVRSFATDDYIMMASGILYAIFMILGQICNSLAFGQDIWMVDPEKLTMSLKLFYIDESFYLTLLVLTKVSLLFFYLRIFPQQWFRRTTFAIMAFVIVSGSIFLLMQIFQCDPIRYNWEGWKGGFGDHRCVNVNGLSSAAAAFSIAQDFIILVLPLPVLFRLNMTPRRKLGIILMFSLGIFIVATSCTRLHYVVHFARSTNPTWDYTDALMWSGLEVAVSIMVTSLPAIRVLMATVWPRFFRTTQPNNSGADGTSSRGRAKEAGGARDKGFRRSRPCSRPGTNRHFGESGLELGDRAKGDVRTRVSADDRPSSSQSGMTGESESRIHVRTTTTSAVVDPNPNKGPQEIKS